MSPKDAGGMTNSVDPDQTAPVSPIWVFIVFSSPYVQKLRIVTVAIKDSIRFVQDVGHFLIMEFNYWIFQEN